MRRLAELVLLAASCANDGGVIINVTPTDPNVTVVRLYIGNGARTTGATLDIPTAVSNGVAVKQAMPSVTYWPRDEQNELDSVAIKSGGSARFVLVRSDTADIGAIIAVGYAGNQIAEVATMFDVHLPATKFNEYKLTLAKPVQPPIAWASLMPVPAPEATCIGVVDPMQSDPYTSAFIVSHDDQDCDGLIVGDGRECNPDVWFGRRPAALDELTCITPGPDSFLSCYLGGPECVDDRPAGTTSGCMPSRYCTPKTVCSACQGNLACAKDVTKGATIRPASVNCPMHSSGGNLCEDEMVLHTGSFGGVGCTAASIADAEHGFADRIDRGTYEIFVSLDPADCRVALKVKGNAPSDAPFVGLMVAIELENGRGIAWPVVLTVAEQGGCLGRDVACMKDAGTFSPDLQDCAVGWSPPMLEGSLVTPQGVPVRSPSLTDDMLEIYWTADDKEVWRSRRSSRIDGWAMPERVTRLEAPGFQTRTARISPDGLKMFLASDRPDSVGGEDLFVATRSSRIETWTTPVHIVELSTQFTDDGGSIDRTGTRLVFSRTEDLVGVRKMYQATRASPSTTLWSSVTQLPPAFENSENPHIVEDGSAIYYTGEELAAGKELYTYQRGVASPWTLPRRLNELGSQGADIDAWVSLDQRAIFFASDRSGTMRIYSSRR